MLSMGELRELTGLGHEDLTAVLDELREAGAAVEAAPGEWRGPYEDEAGEAAARAAMDRRDGRDEELDEEDPGPSPFREERPSEEASEVVLTTLIASALDSETIGKLVQAGINEASSERRAFVLRVLP